MQQTETIDSNMPKKAILLANLGSPDSTAVKDVKTYLKEFLMDERVIDIPALPRNLLVKGIIVPFRAPKSASKYKSIWTEHGSPLIHTTRMLCEKVGRQSGLPTYMCMRYANPTPAFAFEQMAKDNPDLEEVILIPLYPHYAMSSYETAVEHVKNAHRAGNFTFQLRVVEPFYSHPNYISALADSIRPFLEEKYDHILFSYHGIPARHLLKTDPTKSHCLQCPDCCNTPSPAHASCYRHQVIQTTQLVANQLGLSNNTYSFSFQSRLGRDRWLKPFTSEELKAFPGKGIKHLLIVCPAFVSDCLETLEEIHMEGKEDFLHAGGETFRAVPCLNLDQNWVNTVIALIHEQG